MLYVVKRDGRRVQFDSIKITNAVKGAADEIAVNLKESEAPSIQGCEMVYECRIVYKQDLNPDLLSEAINTTFYKNNDYHTIYYAEIVNVICTADNI